MPTVRVELNFFYMHYNDARTFARWALENQNEDVNPSIYVRHAIIAVVFAAEALINRVLNDFAAEPRVSEIFDRASVLDKWYLAPLLCSEGNETDSFDVGAEPYQSFKELIQIRNWLAHPQVDTFLLGELDPKSTIGAGPSGEEYPWLEMLQGEAWPQTRAPKNPFELNHSHADASLQILDNMINALNEKLLGRIHDGWLDLITIKDDDGLHHYQAPVYSIWGGYGGASS